MQEISSAAEQSAVAANCFQIGEQAHAPLIPNQKPAAESDQLPGERIRTLDPLVYAPHWITGGAKHPGLIVETSGLANVAPPPVTYRPHLPRELSDQAILSAIQVERIIYAGQAHAQLLPTGARAGISIGDGTGTGENFNTRRNRPRQLVSGAAKNCLVFGQSRFNRSGGAKNSSD